MNARLAVGVLLVLLLTSAGISAKAPPFVQVTIAGPHVPGILVITDRATLDTLAMDVLEDFSREVVPPALSEPGYELVRYVQGPDGVVRVFDRLRYHTNPRPGWCGYLKYLGSGATTQSFYVGKWFFATAESDAAVQRLLRSQGVALPGERAVANTGCRTYELTILNWSVIAGLVLPVVIALLSHWSPAANRKVTDQQHESRQGH